MVVVFMATVTIASAQKTTPSQTPQPVQQHVQPVQQNGQAPQPVQEVMDFRWGAKGGLNSASQILSGEGHLSFRYAFHLGVFLEKPISRKVDIQPELVYSLQGCKDSGVTLKSDYINLPVMFKIYVDHLRTFSIDLGPQFGYMLGYKATGSNGTTIDVYSASDLKKFDAAVCLGVSYKFERNFNFGLRLNYGATKISSDFYNMVYQFSVGYRF